MYFKALKLFRKFLAQVKVVKGVYIAAYAGKSCRPCVSQNQETRGSERSTSQSLALIHCKTNLAKLHWKKNCEAVKRKGTLHSIPMYQSPGILNKCFGPLRIICNRYNFAAVFSQFIAHFTLHTAVQLQCFFFHYTWGCTVREERASKCWWRRRAHQEPLCQPWRSGLKSSIIEYF